MRAKGPLTAAFVALLLFRPSVWRKWRLWRGVEELADRRVVARLALPAWVQVRSVHQPVDLWEQERRAQTAVSRAKGETLQLLILQVYQ
jgi:hypothetical protein